MDMRRKRSVCTTTIAYLLLSGLLLMGCGRSADPSETASSPVPEASFPVSEGSAASEGPGGSEDPVISGASAVSEASAASETAQLSRQTLTTCPEPVMDGLATRQEQQVLLDYSHADDGYFAVRYTGTSDRLRLMVDAPDGVTYSFSLTGNDWRVLPFSAGSGIYRVDVLEHAYDTKYARLFVEEIDVEITDEFSPFLYPNQYAWFDAKSPLMDFGIALSELSESDLDYLGKVYHWVISNITYDTAKARNIPTAYLPDPLDTFLTKEGICFDYASLMTVLLRSQGIPTRLAVGYSGEVYHAWISVYLEDIGWVDNIIQFDGTGWALMDPTLAAGNASGDVARYVGDGSHYTVKYHY